MTYRFPMKWYFLLMLGSSTLVAKDVRARVDGIGCRTRQLTVKRCWENLEAVTSVEILPRDQRPAPNQRDLILHCPGPAPTLAELNSALGPKAKFYRAIAILPVEPTAE
jgi:hypothetical protein